MDKYYKIQAIQGLIFGMRTDIFELQESEFSTEEAREKIIDKYYKSMKELLDENPYI